LGHRGGKLQKELSVMAGNGLDCIIIGYNEIPFEEYESLLSMYGADSEAYRDLKYSYVDLAGKKLNYVGLLNHVDSLARGGSESSGVQDTFKSCDIPNLAAVYLTHFLRKRGFEVHYINLFQYEKETLRQYLSLNPYCVAITTTFYLMNLPVTEMVKFIRAHNPDVKIIVGGPLIANHARNYRTDESLAALNDIGADIYVIESQGELTLSRTLDCLKAGRDLDGVPNLVYSGDKELQRTERVTENTSLDEDFINWRLFSDQFLGPTVQTRTARSCAFSCSFCNYPTRAGKLTLASLDTVEKELDSIRDLGYVRNVVFIDDTFNVPLARFKDICRLMIRKNYEFNWFSYFRCSNSDEEAVELMARSGCRGTFLGIESGSPTILKNMNKAATADKYMRGIELLRGHNILSFASLIIGFPGETEQTISETINFIKTAKPDYYRAQLWYCEPGTPIERQREQYGITGDGFVWSHATMDSMEAMDHIDRMFLTTDESIWLPQWSFDFWTIPYLLGKGMSMDCFKELMSDAHKLLALDIATMAEREKGPLQRAYVDQMVQTVRRSQHASSVRCFGGENR
jgi:radical SAM PhpK family P-methyltransferase